MPLLCTLLIQLCVPSELFAMGSFSWPHRVDENWFTKPGACVWFFLVINSKHRALYVPFSKESSFCEENEIWERNKASKTFLKRKSWVNGWGARASKKWARVRPNYWPNRVPVIDPTFCTQEKNNAQTWLKPHILLCSEEHAYKQQKPKEQKHHNFKFGTQLPLWSWPKLVHLLDPLFCFFCSLPLAHLTTHQHAKHNSNNKQQQQQQQQQQQHHQQQHITKIRSNNYSNNNNKQLEQQQQQQTIRTTTTILIMITTTTIETTTATKQQYQRTKKQHLKQQQQQLKQQQIKWTSTIKQQQTTATT